MKLFTAITAATAAITFAAAPVEARDITVSNTFTVAGETCTWTTTTKGFGTLNMSSVTTKECEPEYNAVELTEMMGGNFTF